jgi:hypothetical protein
MILEGKRKGLRDLRYGLCLVAAAVDGRNLADEIGSTPAMLTPVAGFN